MLNEEMLSQCQNISFMMIINTSANIKIQNHTGDWGNQYVLVDQSVYLWGAIYVLSLFLPFKLKFTNANIGTKLSFRTTYFYSEGILHRQPISPVRYILKIHFFIEFGLKTIQFKIQFKTKSKIFIQKNIHSKKNPKYSFKKIFIQ